MMDAAFGRVRRRDRCCDAHEALLKSVVTGSGQNHGSPSLARLCGLRIANTAGDLLALIECSECGNAVSSRAAACPKCGFPLQGPARGGANLVARRTAYFLALIGLIATIAAGLLPVSVELSTGEQYDCGQPLTSRDREWSVDSLTIALEIERGARRFAGTTGELIEGLPDEVCPGAIGTRRAVMAVIAIAALGAAAGARVVFR